MEGDGVVEGGKDRVLQDLVAKGLCSVLPRWSLILMVVAWEPTHTYTE